MESLYKYGNIDPPCIIKFKTLKEQYPEAIAVLGIYATSIDEAREVYRRNIRQRTGLKLDGCTHVKAKIGDKLVDNNPFVPHGAIFYTEADLRLSL